MFRVIRQTLYITLATVTGLCLFLGAAELKSSGNVKLMTSQPVVAQVNRPQDVWRQVYDRLPDLPLENHYVSNETGEVDTENTLVSRLIRYHLYVKSRPPNFRFDWKLTLADYLGAHENLVPSQYPSSNTLRENPMEGDRTAIENLSRAQREALIDVLVSIFNPNRPQTVAPTPRVSPSPPTPNPRATPKLPQPGDADLLRL